MYYLWGENKGADQLRSTAKLICAFGFAYADCWFSDAVAHLSVSIPCLFMHSPWHRYSGPEISTFKLNVCLHLSHCIRTPTICICGNKADDQLCSYCLLDNTCHLSGPGSNLGLGMWQGSGRPSRFGGIPCVLLFPPPSLTT